MWEASTQDWSRRLTIFFCLFLAFLWYFVFRSVGSIMSDYSTTGDIPAFGTDLRAVCRVSCAVFYVRVACHALSGSSLTPLPLFPHYTPAGFGGKVGPNAAEASQCFSMSGFPQACYLVIGWDIDF